MSSLPRLLCFVCSQVTTLWLHALLSAEVLSLSKSRCHHKFCHWVWIGVPVVSVSARPELPAVCHQFSLQNHRQTKLVKKDRPTKGFLEKKTTTPKNLTVCFYFSEHNTISIYRMLGIKQLFKQTIWGERQMFARCTIIWPVMKSLQVKRISAEPGTDLCCFRSVMRTCRRCRCRPSSARKNTSFAVCRSQGESTVTVHGALALSRTRSRSLKRPWTARCIHISFCHKLLFGTRGWPLTSFWRRAYRFIHSVNKQINKPRENNNSPLLTLWKLG